MSALPYTSRASGRTRPRFPIPSAPSPSEFPLPSKSKLRALNHGAYAHPRLVPLSALLTAVALAFFVAGLAFSRRFGAVVLDAEHKVSEHMHLVAHEPVVLDSHGHLIHDPDHLLSHRHHDLARQANADDDAHVFGMGVDHHHHSPLAEAHLAHPDMKPPSTREQDLSARPLAEDSASATLQLPPSATVATSDNTTERQEQEQQQQQVQVPEQQKQKQQQQQQQQPQEQPQQHQEQRPSSPVEGAVSYQRSWPATPAADEGGLYRLSRNLNFTNGTLFNYFHMHKTGGVTTKVELLYLLHRPENRNKRTKRGERMEGVETCYQLNEPHGEGNLKSVEVLWRCDFGQINNMTQDQLDSIDVMMGHQYWENGCDAIFGNKRLVRHFSIFRHPLPRKLSFFYHFFVRNLGRDEKEVGKDEVIAFLLGESLPQDPRTRDAGPNYYASRMLSDGTKGFGTDHRYDIPVDEQDKAISIVQGRLEHEFALVGLQLQPEASQCMLQKAMQVLAHEHGIDDLVGTPKLAESTRRLNTGGYTWTARKIWTAMDTKQRERYNQVEKVDLAIYDRVVKRFKEDVDTFSCKDKVRTEEFAEDVFE